jgi:hypothetical protein
MSAVMLALHERQHLYKLPDTIANGIQNWRCFIGRGGRARLECIDHVTHETFGTVKAEAQSVAAHYQVGNTQRAGVRHGIISAVTGYGSLQFCWTFEACVWGCPTLTPVKWQLWVPAAHAPSHC